MHFSTARRALLPVLVLASLFALASSSTLAQDLNGFLRAKGTGDVALSFTSESYDEFWVGEMTVSNPDVGEVDTMTASLWAAYGLADRWTLFATLAWVDAEGDGLAGFEDSGIQDVSAVAAYRIASFGGNDGHTLVGAAGVRTPASDYEGDAPVSLGDDTTDWLARLVYQFRTGGFYVSQQVGYDVRGDDAPDGFPLYTEAGYTFGRTTVNVFLSKYLADGGTDIGDPGFTFPSNEEEFERTGARAYVRINDRFGLSLSGYTTLDGRNTGDSTGGSLGANFSF